MINSIAKILFCERMERINGLYVCFRQAQCFDKKENTRMGEKQNNKNFGYRDGI